MRRIPKKIQYNSQCNASYFCLQVLATWAQSLLLLALGMMINTPTLVVGALLLNTKEGEISLSESQASWFSKLLFKTNNINFLSSMNVDFRGPSRYIDLSLPEKTTSQRLKVPTFRSLLQEHPQGVKRNVMNSRLHFVVT